MSITKAMLSRCQNELKQVFCALPPEVQKLMRDNSEYVQVIGDGGEFRTIGIDFATRFVPCGCYRLDPNMPTEPEQYWVEYALRPGPRGYCVVHEGHLDGCPTDSVLLHPLGLGIVYRDANGVETLRTSVDIAFGTPVRVRFRK